MSNIVKAEALKVAESAGRNPVLYCINFNHGISKIGATTNLVQRLSAHTSHGVFNSMVSSVHFAICPRHTLYKAERYVINELALKYESVSREAFFIPSNYNIQHVLNDAVLSCKDIKDIEYPKSHEDYHAVALKCGLYNTFRHLARGKSIDRIISFVMDSMGTTGETPTEDEFYEMLSGCDMDSIHILAPLIIKNGVLIGRGVEYQKRKIILEEFAIELRGEAKFLMAA